MEEYDPTNIAMMAAIAKAAGGGGGGSDLPTPTIVDKDKFLSVVDDGKGGVEWGIAGIPSVYIYVQAVEGSGIVSKQIYPNNLSRAELFRLVHNTSKFAYVYVGVEYFNSSWTKQASGSLCAINYDRYSHCFVFKGTLNMNTNPLTPYDITFKLHDSDPNLDELEVTPHT